MDPTVIINTLPGQRTQPDSLLASSLRPGDRLAGRVLQLENDGRVLMDLAGTRMKARLGFDVRPGQTLKLTVVESGPPLQLKADLPPESAGKVPASEGDVRAARQPADSLPSGLNPVDRRQLLDTLQQLVARAAPGASAASGERAAVQAMQQIKMALDPLPLDQPVAQIAQRLRNALEDHGGLFEKRLADLEMGKEVSRPERDAPAAAAPGRAAAHAVIKRDVKAQLMLLRHLLAAGDPDPAKILRADDRQLTRLSRGIEKMLLHLEQQQERATMRAGEGTPHQVFSHAIALDERQPPVQIKVYYPRKGKEDTGPASHRIALLLEMDRLGTIRGDIARLPNGLKIQFFVPDREIQDLFNSKSREIVAALTGLFDDIQVAVSVSPERIEQFHKEETPLAASGRIDIKA